MVQTLAGQDTTYKELMRNCLASTQFDRKRAVQLFLRQFPPNNWIETFAYKLVREIYQELPHQPRAHESINRMISELDLASELALQRYRDGLPIDDFIKVMEKKQRMFGFDRNNNNYFTFQQQNNNVNTQNLVEDIAKLQQQLGIPAGIPGLSTIQAGPPPTPGSQAQ